MVKVDLRAQIVLPSVRCWRLFPGSSYKFLETFISENVAFLDMPGFQMPQGKLKDDKVLSMRIRASEIVLEKLSKEGKDRIPSVTEAELKSFRVGRKRQRNAQAMITFFDVAAKGDLIVTPEPLVAGKVRIGTFDDEPGNWFPIKVPRSYGLTPIPARRVRWLKGIEENKISSPLSFSLRHQHPFSLIEKTLFFEIFSLAFDSYVYNDRHSSVIFNTKSDYTDRETALMGIVSSLAANYCEAVESDRKNKIDPLMAILSQASMEYHCSQASDVHSPGFNRFTSSTPTALVIAAVIAALSVLSSCSDVDQVEAVVKTIEYVNTSASPDDPCTAVVSKTADRILKSMGSDKLWEMCQAMKNAEARAGLESSAKVTK